MIVGVYLKNFKCYQATQFIALHTKSSEQLIGFLGDNGVGKSAILEGLEAFFSKKPKWLKNKEARKGDAECFVAPVFLLKLGSLKKVPNLDAVKALSATLINGISGLELPTDCIAVCIAKRADGGIKIFDGKKELDSKMDSAASDLYEFIGDHYQFIYNNAEVDIDEAAKVDSEASEIIVGSPIIPAVEKKIIEIDNNNEFVEKLNAALKELIDDTVTKELKKIDPEYSYSGTKGALSKLTTNVLARVSSIAFLDSRKLKLGGMSLENLSSWQRRTALLDFMMAMLESTKPDDDKQLILAIDEPEISLDATKKMSQFERLVRIAGKGVSVMFTSHWYGWIAGTKIGRCLLIEDNGTQKRDISVFNIADFPFGRRPIPKFEMRMIFDFLISLGAGAEADPDQRFIICEGPSDQIFLSTSLNDTRYKIIFVGKERIINMVDSFKKYYWKNAGPQIKNILFLIDTDPVNQDSFDNPYLRRWSKDSGFVVDLINGKKDFERSCEIEDALEPAPFLEALKKVCSEKLIQDLAVKYPDLRGSDAFGMDGVTKNAFEGILKLVKVPVAEQYQKILTGASTVNHIKQMVEKNFV